jgi:hypothetical protein
MLKSHRLAKSIQDAGRAAFLSILAYKAACAGRRVMAVNPAFTIQTRSGCGVMVHKSLSAKAYRSAGVVVRTVARARIGAITRRSTENGSGRTFGEGLRWRPRRTEKLSGCSLPVACL